ncbi:MAG: hypothetical protein HYU63_04745, partial [Armatimonadetes bacterium]|nr:hypothetical protein [Armatimonadota bacterium]
MDKGRHSKKEDNFWFKFLVAVIVVLWISLVLGNYLGYLFVKSKWFTKTKGEKLKTASYQADEFIYSTP